MIEFLSMNGANPHSFRNTMFGRGKRFSQSIRSRKQFSQEYGIASGADWLP